MKFAILLTVVAVVAAAPYDKKVFSDEFLDKLKKEILEKVISQDAHVTSPSSCVGYVDGNYPNSSNCNSYISCSGGVKYVRYCQSGLNYNPHLDKCSYPYEYQCPL